MNKLTLKTTLLSLSTALLLSISGCSSSSSSDDTTSGGGTGTAASYSGTGIDGILVGSTVCIDVNENAACDADEPTDPDGTDAQGKFEIPETLLTGPLLLIGGTDIGTGLPFTGALTAPAGSTVVTPLTSAVQSLVKSGKSPEEAEANIKAALGLTNVDVNLTSFDPFAETSANAQAVLASQAHLQTIVHAASVAVASADANKSTGDVMGDVFAQISQSFDGATGDVNLTVADVTAVTKSVANDLYADNPVALVSVKNNAEATAQSAVDAAETTQATIIAGTPAQAQGSLNAGITLVNTSISADIDSSTAASVTAAGALNATELQGIVDAQRLQEEKEAAIAQAVKDALAAQKALDDAEIASANASAAEAKAAYDALLEAQAEQLRQAEVQRAAEAAAAEAAAQAAAQEAQLAANQAAKEAAAAVAAAELKAAQDKAIAEKAEADARIAAAEEAARVAKAAADFNAAKIAAENAERNAAVNIMKTQAEALVANAFGYISQVAASRDSVVFIQSLDINYTNDTAIIGLLSQANNALTLVSTYAGDTNSSAQDLYTFAGLIAADVNVTDANVTEANTTLELVIAKEALAKTQITDAQIALDNTRARVLEIRALIAEAQAQVAADAEKQRIIGLVNAALTRANDNNVSIDLIGMDTSITLAAFDLNATNAIATQYPNIGVDSTSAQAAYDRALIAKTEAVAFQGDLNDSISIINAELVKANDANTTELLSQAEAIKAQTAAREVSLLAGEVAGIEQGINQSLLAAQVLEQAEVDRVTGEAIAALISGSRSDAQEAKLTADNNITSIDGQAAQALEDAQTISNISTTADISAEGSAAAAAATAAGTAYQTALQAQASVDSNVTAANAATTAGDAAAAALNAANAAVVVATQTAIVVEQAGIANAQLVAAQVKADAVGSGDTNTTDPVADNIWIDGKTFHSFEFNLDDGQIALRYSDIQLSGDEILFTGHFYDFNSSTWIVGEDSKDISLQADGSWAAPLTETYVIDETNSSIMTINGSEQVALLSATSIAGQTIGFDIRDTNITIPVLFSDGAVNYRLAFKQAVDTYRLDWTPRNWETGATFATLEEYMLKDGNFYWDESTNSGVEVQRDQNRTAFLDKNGTAITTLALGQTGNLISWNQDHNVSTVVGEWEAINLPNQTVLTVAGTLNEGIENYDAYMEYGQQLVTLYDDGTNGPVVRKVELELASAEFRANDEVLGNTIARDDILNAIAAFEFPVLENPLVTFFKDRTLWSQVLDDNGSAISNTLESQTFNSDVTTATWQELVYAGQDPLCTGSLDVTFEANGTITGVATSDSCDVVDATPVNLFVEVNDSWNYILVNQNRWYFDEQDARNDFLSTSVATDGAFILPNLMDQKAFYEVQLEGNKPGIIFMDFSETDTTFTVSETNGTLLDTLSYSQNENNLTIMNFEGNETYDVLSFYLPTDANVSYFATATQQSGTTINYYFADLASAEEFAGVAGSGFDLNSYISGNTLYYVEQIDPDFLGQAALFNFELNGSMTGEDAAGYYDDGVTYTIIENNVTRSDGIVFSHFSPTPDNKGEMFEVYANGTFLGELVLYANPADRDTELTSTVVSLAGEWGETDAPNTGLLLRLTTDGNFDTNQSNELEHGTYTFEVTNLMDGGDAEGTMIFTTNDDANVNDGLLRSTSDGNCTFGLYGTSLEIACGDYSYSLLSASSSSSNTPPIAQNDIYLTMFEGESIQGVVSASDSDGDALTFTPTLNGTFGVGTELNTTTGVFTIVAGVEGPAQIVVTVEDINGASDEVNLNINVIVASSGTNNNDQGSYSRRDETLTLDQFNTATLFTIPGDTQLHTFWGVNDGVLEHDIMEFNTTSLELMFSENDENETIYFTDTLDTGDVNASVGGAAYDAANQIVEFKLLEIITDTALLTNELNITMPDGSVAYKAAVLMVQDEFDFWHEARDYTQDQNGTVYNSLDTLILSGMAVQDHNNWSRALVFDKNTSGNLVEVDFTGYFQTGNLDDIYVINPSAGTWELNATQVNDTVITDVLYVNPTDTQRFQSKIYVLDDFGVDGNVTNTVWEGELREAGRIEVEYEYNDIAAQAILDALSNDGVLVDPYIVGATLCEDVNVNGTCDQGEQLSSTTGENGGFTFDSPLTPGSHIIIAVQGTHEGKLYDLDLGAVVDENGSVSVVSPMTTFVARGLTTDQLVEILNKAASDENASTSWSITAADILANPLENGVAQKSITDLNDADFVALQASMASYGILKIMEGSKTLSDLNGTALYVSGTTTGGEVNLIARAVLSGVSSAMNKSVLEGVNAALVQAKTTIATDIQAYLESQNMSSAEAHAQAVSMAEVGLPEPQADLVIKMAVVAIDRLATVGYETCNSTGGDVSQALSAVASTYSSIATQTAMMNLGQTYYALVYSSNITNLMSQTGMSQADFGPAMEAGLFGATNGATTFRFDASNALVAE